MTNQTKTDLIKVEELLDQRLFELRSGQACAKEDITGGRLSRLSETLTLAALRTAVRIFT